MALSYLENSKNVELLENEAIHYTTEIKFKTYSAQSCENV